MALSIGEALISICLFIVALLALLALLVFLIRLWNHCAIDLARA